MKLPLSWLKEFIDCNQPIDALQQLLTRCGLEVETITPLNAEFSNVVAADILQVDAHPAADRLQVATLYDGLDKLQVVCGASNCQPGKRAALARVGARLLDKNQQPYTIKKSRLRGVESHGMLCAPDELGIAGDPSKLLELPTTLAAGTDLQPYLADCILELSITPNLGHCLSVRGIARELAAQLTLPFRNIDTHLEESPSIHANQLLQIKIDSPACQRYLARIICGVQVGDSPQWLQRRLQQCGLPPINNIVDATNYAMLALGQPLHAFDLAEIEGQKVQITTACPATTLQTLNNTSIDIPPQALMIGDSIGPLAFAGIIGGQRAAIKAQTTDLLLEAAHFSPQAIRRTCKQTGLTSEAAYRFARGIDPLQLQQALNFAAHLIQSLAGGTIATGMLEATTTPFHHRQITCRPQRCNQLLGTTLTGKEISALLERVGCKMVTSAPAELLVQIPSHRNDLTTEIDLVAEIARLYDWQRLPTKPSKISLSTLPDAPLDRFEEHVRIALVALGLQECSSCPLIHPQQASPNYQPLTVLHAHSLEYSALRHSLLPGLLQIVKFNQDRQRPHLALFEVGKTYARQPGGVAEQLKAALLLTGNKQPLHWQAKTQRFDFFDLKGKLEMLGEMLAWPELRLMASQQATLHPLRQATIESGDQQIGDCGEVHPQLLQDLEIKERVFFAELSLPEMLGARLEERSFQPLPLYPGSSRDWTVQVADSLSLQELLAAIARQRPALLESVALIDLYRDDKIGPGKKNLTLRFDYRETEQTIAAAAVEREHGRLLAAVEKELAAAISPLPWSREERPNDA